MLAFGGIGTLLGPILGAVVFTAIDEVLIEFGQLRLLAYGILIIVLFLWIRRGMIPTLRDLLRRQTTNRDTTAAHTPSRGPG
jgi:branched-chain amino acid transport system permease protein